MPRPPRAQLANATYHVTARGNRGQPLYLEPGDHLRFLELLGGVVTVQGWNCIAYCLMTNHFHLIVATPKPNLAVGMHALNGVYARWFNWRHGFRGHLFERRYHAGLVESDWHMLESCRYVVLNPVRAGLARRPSGWPWSSYRATVGLVEPPAFLSATRLLAYFGSEPGSARRAFASFVADGRERSQAA